MKKELAKFFAGLTAWEAVVHISLAACDMLPIDWCGIRITPAMNTVQIILPGLMSLWLAWYGWLHKSPN